MRSMFLLLCSAAVAAVPVASSAQMAGRVLNPRYVQESQSDHPKLIAEFGGAETGPRAAYVDSVGRRVAAFSGVAPNSYRFTVLNSAVENAFATPGGYVYITRQLMGFMDNESELAFALGHEVGRAREQRARRHVLLDEEGHVRRVGRGGGTDVQGCGHGVGNQLE